jgi:CRP/FNR family cyclic AMP-dependent transcriptional regulator
MDPKLALERSPAFEGLDQDQIDRVAKLVMVRDYGRDDVVFQQGDDAFALCIIIEGSVSLQAKMAGRLLELEVLGPGALLAWSGLVEPHTFTSTAVCLKPTTLAIIKVKDLNRLMDEDSRLGCVFQRNLAAVISRRFHESQERLARNMVGW